MYKTCFQGGVHPAGQTSTSHRGVFWAGGSSGGNGVSGKNVKVCRLTENELFMMRYFLCITVIWTFEYHQGGELLQLHSDPRGRGVFTRSGSGHRSPRLEERRRVDVFL